MKTKKLLSLLKYQWHADRTKRSVKSILVREPGNHLRRRQTFSGSRYAGVALFERLASKFGLLFDLNPVFRHQRRHYCYAFSFEEPGKNSGETPVLSYIMTGSHRLPRQALAPAKSYRVMIGCSEEKRRT